MSNEEMNKLFKLYEVKAEEKFIVCINEKEEIKI